MGLKTGEKHTRFELGDLLFDGACRQEVLAVSDAPELRTNLPKEEFRTPFVLVWQ